MLSHVDRAGQPAMVDVGAKPATARSAHARATITFPPAVAAALRASGYMTAKGSIFTVAHVAGVMAAKATPQLIPLCHGLLLDDCSIAFEPEADGVRIDCRVSCRGPTGVEMEALTGASVAALTVYDMCKALGHDIVIRDIRLIAKRGGKRDFTAADDA